MVFQSHEWLSGSEENSCWGGKWWARGLWKHGLEENDIGHIM
jgi:hypothetical protein